MLPHPAIVSNPDAGVKQVSPEGRFHTRIPPHNSEGRFRGRVPNRRRPRVPRLPKAIIILLRFRPGLVCKRGCANREGVVAT